MFVPFGVKISHLLQKQTGKYVSIYVSSRENFRSRCLPSVIRLHNFSSPISGDVKTTLLLNVNPSQQQAQQQQQSVDIHTATIFECARHESSIFYQRQVDDVIVVNSTIKPPPQEVETRSNRNKKDVTSSSTVLQGYDRFQK